MAHDIKIKAKAIHAVTVHEEEPKDVAARLGVPVKTVHDWVRNHKKNQPANARARVRKNEPELGSTEPACFQPVSSQIQPQEVVMEMAENPKSLELDHWLRRCEEKTMAMIEKRLEVCADEVFLKVNPEGAIALADHTLGMIDAILQNRKTE